MLDVNAKNSETVTVVSIHGRIVCGETESLRETVQQINSRSIILDLARVSAIDAHGLGVLLQLRELAQTKGASFELMNVSKPLRRVFEITKLDSVFRISASVQYLRPVAMQRRTPVAA
jgi:anti-sigma B factor antagonist